MKPTEITMQIVKSIGLYETCRLEATFTLDSGDNLETAFKSARRQLENAYKTAYGIKTEKNEKREIDVNSHEFERICKALKDGKTDLKDLEKYFIVSQEAVNYFKTNKLI